jgi:hypothetical protein
MFERVCVCVSERERERKRERGRERERERERERVRRRISYIRSRVGGYIPICMAHIFSPTSHMNERGRSRVSVAKRCHELF